MFAFVPTVDDMFDIPDCCILELCLGRINRIVSAENAKCILESCCDSHPNRAGVTSDFTPSCKTRL